MCPSAPVLGGLPEPWRESWSGPALDRQLPRKNNGVTTQGPPQSRGDRLRGRASEFIMDKHSTHTKQLMTQMKDFDGESRMILGRSPFPLVSAAEVADGASMCLD